MNGIKWVVQVDVSMRKGAYNGLQEENRSFSYI